MSQTHDEPLCFELGMNASLRVERAILRKGSLNLSALFSSSLISSLSWLLPGCDALGLAHGLLLRLDALVDVSRPQMPTEPPLCASALSCSQRSPPRSGPLCLQALTCSALPLPPPSPFSRQSALGVVIFTDPNIKP